MFEWSDDDDVLVAPPPSMKAPPRSTCVEDQSKGSEEVPEQQAKETPTQQTVGISVGQAMRIPKQQAEVTP